MRTSADLFLDIANRHLDQLSNTPGPVLTGDSPSDYFALALISSIFAAFAVEFAMSELIWTRAFLQTPRPYRSVTASQGRRARTIPEKVSLLQSIADLDASLLGDVRRLMQYRNRVAHANVQPFDANVLDVDAIERINAGGREAECDAAHERWLQGDDQALDRFKDEFSAPPGLAHPARDRHGRHRSRT
ncbi:MAG: hypothetical protein EXR66_07060 [Dehalococcoidia bacterium]|nr:hypothetical protein [Dehalococcoidia bacterium]